jgi:uncharacterized SAM-binding protein YcdF (DUF218 family)
MRSLLTTPLGWVFLIGIGGFLRAALRRRDGAASRPSGTGSRLFAAAWLLLMTASCPFVAGALAAGLGRLGERWPEPPRWAGAQPPDTVVVLSGGLLGDDRGPGVPLGGASLERLHAGLAAARRWPGARILFSGGAPDGAPVSAGQRMVEEALRSGLPPERLIVEEHSPDTRGNAVHGAALLRGIGAARVALVTSSDHMARSRAAFAREGIATLPVASAPPPRVARRAGNLLPDADALSRTTSVVHEAVGLLVYRIRGWI